MTRRRIIAASAGLLLVLVCARLWATRDHFRSTADRLLLLLPDGVSFSDPKVTVWLDAGNEEGLHVIPVHDSEFIRPLLGETSCAGVILPDSVHFEASDLFVAAIRRFVATGGKLMLVYDAGTRSLTGRYANGRSRLSDLAGVDYALYDTLHDKTIRWSEVEAGRSTVDRMEIPPGKYYPLEPGLNRVALSASFPQTDRIRLRDYMYGDLQYPSFVTSGSFSGQTLFYSDTGVVAGEHQYGQGSVLFVNLPLGYLKSVTDGLPLHAFLKYFADQVLALPALMTVPDGVGGLVLNWHIDSNAAIKPLQEMSSWSVLRQGPYSIHITAGPDAMAIGDGRGFNVESNPASQELIRKYVALGYEIGSHGGWIHNYFASHVDKGDSKDIEQFLTLNKTALENMIGKRVVEYSAPNGNQPPWVTHWLESHGFIAYYFTGDTGMGPTQGYRDGQREGRDIWAFPILHLDRAAGFEEMETEGYSDVEVESWLRAITRFVADQHRARLIYFHPPGILAYQQIVDRWLQQTGDLKAAGRFRWYTMTGLAQFLTMRREVKWKVAQNRGIAAVSATHPVSLEHQAWSLPASRFAEPSIVRGNAKVIRVDDSWIVIAGNGTELQFETKLLNP
jgi:peptidoglycan/xylan/chitin deacetylase (PgdA/CDA1 family)